MKPIRVWRFEDAPKRYAKLSTNGGDEDWLAFVPKEYGHTDCDGVPYIGWLGTSFGCCSVDWTVVPGGWVVIGSHA